MTEPTKLAANAGAEHGRQDAIMFLFAGAVDDDAILVLDGRLAAGERQAFESLPNPQDITRDYTPTAIALASLTSGVESPYSWYLSICEAYDVAYNKAVTDHIHTVAIAIREGVL